MLSCAQDGLIVERGRHDDLLALGEVYSSMWKQQQESLNTEGGVELPHPPGESQL